MQQKQDSGKKCHSELVEEPGQGSDLQIQRSEWAIPVWGTWAQCCAPVARARRQPTGPWRKGECGRLGAGGKAPGIQGLDSRSRGGAQRDQIKGVYRFSPPVSVPPSLSLPSPSASTVWPSSRSTNYIRPTFHPSPPSAISLDSLLPAALGVQPEASCSPHPTPGPTPEVLASEGA